MQDFEISISSPTIKLGQFLKLANLAETGGHAKELIAAGEITVNGEITTARGLTLQIGDRVCTPEACATITLEDPALTAADDADEDDFDPEKWRNL
ncbi:RNA-binding S4 domain-containing protein [Corynebacterium caspium]|uniref:RNA-binding S4 domain-containing protein n=1 Tax=Corynebacterium caspium TaxID=234828 RepID=UPI00037F0216|nr:RNA-binding S4 domain-containing protein [Corynebacterium caspium]WKD58502.1 ribosome-associated protein [Corynebacterium caspium DSM 44850]